MNIQATTTSIASSVSGINPASLSTPVSQEAAKTESGDSLTISAQGLDMFKQTQAASQAALEAVNDVESKDDSATLKTVLEGTSETEEDEDDTTTTTDLSSLSDSQIAQKVADGTITQAEADAELASRKSKSEGEGTAQNTASNNDAAAMNMAISIDVMI